MLICCFGRARSLHKSQDISAGCVLMSWRYSKGLRQSNPSSHLWWCWEDTSSHMDTHVQGHQHKWVNLLCMSLLEQGVGPEGPRGTCKPQPFQDSVSVNRYLCSWISLHTSKRHWSPLSSCSYVNNFKQQRLFDLTHPSVCVGIDLQNSTDTVLNGTCIPGWEIIDSIASGDAELVLLKVIKMH